MFHLTIGFFLLVVAFGLFPHVATALFKLGVMAGIASAVVIGIIYIIAETRWI